METTEDTYFAREIWERLTAFIALRPELGYPTDFKCSELEDSRVIDMMAALTIAEYDLAFNLECVAIMLQGLRVSRMGGQ
jgi:hypothetical protein